MISFGGGKLKRIFIFLVSLNFLILNAQDFDGQFTVSPSCGDATSSEVYTITNNSSQTLEFQILSEYEEFKIVGEFLLNLIISFNINKNLILNMFFF